MQEKGTACVCARKCSKLMERTNKRAELHKTARNYKADTRES